MVILTDDATPEPLAESLKKDFTEIDKAVSVNRIFSKNILK